MLPHLRGDEGVQVLGLTPDGGRRGFRLPGIVPVARHLWDDGRETWARLALDGLHLDLRRPPWRVDLTWRGWIAACPRYLHADLSLAPLDQAAGLPVPVLEGLGHPEEAAP